jgi:hypothetical protein
VVHCAHCAISGAAIGPDIAAPASPALEGNAARVDIHFDLVVARFAADQYERPARNAEAAGLPVACPCVKIARSFGSPVRELAYRHAPVRCDKRGGKVCGNLSCHLISLRIVV